jgi:hypothetical protein
MKNYKFTELPKRSQKTAIRDYQDGWNETRERSNDGISDTEAFSILSIDLEHNRYTKEGYLIEGTE